MITDKVYHRVHAERFEEEGVREMSLPGDTPLLTHLSSKWVDEIGRMFWSAPLTNGRIIALVIPDAAWMQATLRKRDDTWIINGIGVRSTHIGRGLGTILLSLLEPPIEAKCLEENTLGEVFWQARMFELVKTEKTSVDKDLHTWRLESWRLGRENS